MNGKKAAVFILLGQSNAVGHGVPMEDKDIIREPLKNVFGLSREDNQSFDNKELFWSGYTSAKMNLAEEQDNTSSVANCLASLWQGHIDSGNEKDLPDLYIIQIAIGAQGVCPGYMWNPEKERILIPGRLGTVNIALFDFCKHVFSMLDSSFERMGREYEIIGLHWRGGEEDTAVDQSYLSEHLEAIYTEILCEFGRLLKNPPIVLHRLVCHDRMNEKDPTGKKLEKMNYVNSVFDSLADKHENVSVFDVRHSPQFIPNVRCNGIFLGDAVHFTPQVNLWVAERILLQYARD